MTLYDLQFLHFFAVAAVHLTLVCWASEKASGLSDEVLVWLSV